jgi:very-short-patch-repair endonuclease
MTRVRRILRTGNEKSASPGAKRARALERALSALAARQHGVVAAWQLLELGFTQEQMLLRVRQGRLYRLHLGVYAVGHLAVTRKGRWLAAVLAAGRAAVLSHRDAAALWEIADFTGPDVEVTLPELGGRFRAGIRIHRTRRLPPVERSVVRGIPVTAVERTMLDLAAVIAPRHLRDAYVEGERKGLVDHDTMERILADGNGRRGLRVLSGIFDEVTPTLARTLSPLEVRFLDFCRDHGLPEPHVNVWVSGYLVDACWPDADVVVELDSYEYHRGRVSFERDRAEIGDLKLNGIDVIPVTSRRLAREPTKVAAAIRSALHSTTTPKGEADSSLQRR